MWESPVSFGKTNSGHHGDILECSLDELEDAEHLKYFPFSALQAVVGRWGEPFCAGWHKVHGLQRRVPCPRGTFREWWSFGKWSLESGVMIQNQVLLWGETGILWSTLLSHRKQCAIQPLIKVANSPYYHVGLFLRKFIVSGVKSKNLLCAVPKHLWYRGGCPTSIGGYQSYPLYDYSVILPV